MSHARFVRQRTDVGLLARERAALEAEAPEFRLDRQARQREASLRTSLDTVEAAQRRDFSPHGSVSHCGYVEPSRIHWASTTLTSKAG